MTPVGFVSLGNFPGKGEVALQGERNQRTPCLVVNLPTCLMARHTDFIHWDRGYSEERTKDNGDGGRDGLDFHCRDKAGLLLLPRAADSILNEPQFEFPCRWMVERPRR